MDKYNKLIESLTNKIHTLSDNKTILSMWTVILMSMITEKGMYSMPKCIDYIKSDKSNRMIKGLYFLYNSEIEEGIDDNKEIDRLKEDIVKLCEEIQDTPEYKEMFNMKEEII